MSSTWNRHMNSHFAGCRVLAYGFDIHRQREVKLCLIPGDWENVGVSDGTDSWICPASCNPFGDKHPAVSLMLADLKAGRPLPPAIRTDRSVAGGRERRRLVDDGPKPRERRSVDVESPAQPSRSRRVILA